MIHYIGDVSFFFSFTKNPQISRFFLFVKDPYEFKLRVNNENISNVTLFYVGDIVSAREIVFHQGFYSKIEYLFVYFTNEIKRKQIANILSHKTSYYERHNFLKNLYKEIMDTSEDFFVYSPQRIIVNNSDKEIVLRDLSYFSLFTRKSVFKDEEALLEKTEILAKNPSKVFVSDNKDNFVILPKN